MSQHQYSTTPMSQKTASHELATSLGLNQPWILRNADKNKVNLPKYLLELDSNRCKPDFNILDFVTKLMSELHS